MSIVIIIPGNHFSSLTSAFKPSKKKGSSLQLGYNQMDFVIPQSKISTLSLGGLWEWLPTILIRKLN
jgi:hypothetical protein